ncbi:MAG: hypothetical protein WAU25_12290 [Nitrososphaeraceae archaeon]
MNLTASLIWRGLVEHNNNQSNILRRHTRNPILIPDEQNWWESGDVFNCATLYDGHRVHMLYRNIERKAKLPNRY